MHDESQPAGPRLDLIPRVAYYQRELRKAIGGAKRLKPARCRVRIGVPNRLDRALGDGRR